MTLRYGPWAPDRLARSAIPRGQPPLREPAGQYGPPAVPAGHIRPAVAVVAAAAERAALPRPSVRARSTWDTTLLDALTAQSEPGAGYVIEGPLGELLPFHLVEIRFFDAGSAQAVLDILHRAGFQLKGFSIRTVPA